MILRLLLVIGIFLVASQLFILIYRAPDSFNLTKVKSTIEKIQKHGEDKQKVKPEDKSSIAKRDDKGPIQHEESPSELFQTPELLEMGKEDMELKKTEKRKEKKPPFPKIFPEQQPSKEPYAHSMEIGKVDEDKPDIQEKEIDLPGKEDRVHKKASKGPTSLDNITSEKIREIIRKRREVERILDSAREGEYGK